VGVQAEGSTMLHLESYGVGEGSPDAELVERIRAGEWRWFQDGPPPAQLRDPSAYLLTTARRSYVREGLA